MWLTDGVHLIDAAGAPTLLVLDQWPCQLTPGLLQVGPWLAYDDVNICLCPQHSGWLQHLSAAAGC